MESTLSYGSGFWERKSTRLIAVIVLVVFHQAGLIGLHLEETRELFQQLVPMNLLLTLTLLLFHRPWKTQFAIFCFLIFWAGYLVELLGVTTNVVFGPYHYERALGSRWQGFLL